LKFNKTKNFTNKWLRLSEYHWFYIITDYGKVPDGHVVDCVTYYRPYNALGAIEIELRTDEPHQFTEGWKSFEPTHNQKRLAMKGVFR
jgi:hypothetical protein